MKNFVKFFDVLPKWLSQHYEFSIVLSIGSALLSLVEGLIPVLRLATLIVGLIIAGITLHEKLTSKKNGKV